MRPELLVMHKRQTLAFIDEAAETITLQRTTRVTTAAGGFVDGVAANAAPQKMRVVKSTKQMPNLPHADGEGETHVIEHTLIARWDADVKPGDRFTSAEGDPYVVESVHPKREYRTIARLQWLGDA